MKTSPSERRSCIEDFETYPPTSRKEGRTYTQSMTANVLKNVDIC